MAVDIYPRYAHLIGARGRLTQLITEGLLTVVGSVVIYFAVPDFPEEVEWLSSEEKAFVKARLYEDVGYSKRDDPITFKSVLQVFKDRELVMRDAFSTISLSICAGNVILGGLMYFGLIVPAYGYGQSYCFAFIDLIGH